MNEGKRNFLVGLVIALCCVVWLVYEMSIATPDVRAEVLGLIAFIVIGLVIVWQISGSRDEGNYPWKK